LAIARLWVSVFITHWVNPLADSHLPARSDFAHLQARAHRGKLGLNVFRIHTF
jgi:hypothetical protein